MSQVSSIGAHHAKFGAFAKKHGGAGRISAAQGLQDLLLEAAHGAAPDAAIDPASVDAIWLGSFAPGALTSQHHLGRAPGRPAAEMGAMGDAVGSAATHAGGVLRRIS